jgi:uncharacterized protein YoxC
MTGCPVTAGVLHHVAKLLTQDIERKLSNIQTYIDMIEEITLASFDQWWSMV